MCKFIMFITAVCVLFLIKLRWPKNKSIDWETFSILENWSLRRGRRFQEVVAYKRLKILRFDWETFSILEN